MAAVEGHSDVADDSVNMTAETEVDEQGSSSTGQLVSSADVDTHNSSGSVSQSHQQGAVNGSGRVSSLSTVAGLLSRRSKTPVTPTDASPTVVTLHDVRKFVFQATARSDKRIMGGLTAHTFTSQTFISSFAVGLAVGSILAIIIKLFTEIGGRALLYRR